MAPGGTESDRASVRKVNKMLGRRSGCAARQVQNGQIAFCNLAGKLLVDELGQAIEQTAANIALQADVIGVRIQKTNIALGSIRELPGIPANRHRPETT